MYRLITIILFKDTEVKTQKILRIKADANDIELIDRYRNTDIYVGQERAPRIWYYTVRK